MEEPQTQLQPEFQPQPRNELAQRAQALVDRFFDPLYRYFARRVSTPTILSFALTATFQKAFQALKNGQEPTLLDLYRFAFELLSKEVEKMAPSKSTTVRDDTLLKKFIEKSLEKYAPDGLKTPTRRMPVFEDVYRLRFDSSQKVFHRPPQIEFLYEVFALTERGSLFLTYFEQLTDSERAYVLGMEEGSATQLFLETLKRAREMISMSTPPGSLPQRSVQYFGNVTSMLQKTREEEEISPDEKLYASLTHLFMKEFEPSFQHSQMASFATQSQAQSEPAFSAREKMGPEGPISRTTRVERVEEESAWEGEDENWARPFFRKLQAVFVVGLVIAVVAGVYFGFFSADRQIDRLLNDSRVVFLPGFTQEEKEFFVKTALYPLSKKRDFTKVTIQKINGMVGTLFELTSGTKENFILRPYPAEIAWQPKDYRKLKVL